MRFSFHIRQEEMGRSSRFDWCVKGSPALLQSISAPLEGTSALDKRKASGFFQYHRVRGAVAAYITEMHAAERLATAEMGCPHTPLRSELTHVFKPISQNQAFFRSVLKQTPLMRWLPFGSEEASPSEEHLLPQIKCRHTLHVAPKHPQNTASTVYWRCLPFLWGYPHHSSLPL